MQICREKETDPREREREITQRGERERHIHTTYHTLTTHVHTYTYLKAAYHFFSLPIADVDAWQAHCTETQSGSGGHLSLAITLQPTSPWPSHIRRA